MVREGLGSGRVAVALVAMLVALVHAGAPVASVVTESVDISLLEVQEVDVVFSLPPEDAAALDDADLAARCITAVPSLTCRPERDEASGRITFDVSGEPVFGLEELTWREGTDGTVLRLKLSFEYRPVQFAMAPGLLADRRDLTIRYPSHRAVVEDLRDMPTFSTFILSGPEGTLDLPDDVEGWARELVIGDALLLPQLPGALCVAAVVREGEPRPVLNALSPGCTPFPLSTTGLIAGGDAELVVVSVRTGGDDIELVSSRVPLSLEQPDIVVAVRPDGDVVTGPAFDVDVRVDGPVDACEVSLVDLEGNRMEHLSLTTCGRIRLSTAKLEPGRYLVRARATRGELEGIGTAVVTFVATRTEGVVFTTDKDVYAAGETVSVYPEREGDVCEVTISDMDGATVTRTSAGGCAPAQLALDEALEPGTYEVRTELFQGGSIVATGVKTVEVVDWQPRRGSVHSTLCFGGSLPVLDTSIPCIGPRMMCHPTSESIPLCLCFDADGRPRDVCEYRDTCVPDQGADASVCKPPPSPMSPFTVIRSRGRCVAKRGLETLSCVEVGELCTGTCVCLDPSDRALSPCTAGQACTLTGCRDPAFVFEVKGFDPIHVRTGAVAEEVQLTWKGVVKVGERLDDKRVREQLTASAFLGGTGGTAPETSFDASRNEWTFTSGFTHHLEPGRYDAFLMLSVGDDMLLVRRPFEMWYPLEKSELDMEVVSVKPRRLSIADVEQGATVQLNVRISDGSGAPVPFVPASAMTATVGDEEGGVRADVTSAGYERHTGLWTVVVYLRGVSTMSDHLTLSVGHLGRTGQARTRLDILERIPLSLDIIRVEPGTQEDPLFLLLAGLGFDMDVLMDLEGGDRISADSFTVMVGDHDVSEAISYIYRTSVGVRLHLSSARLCPTPDRPMPLDVVVTVRDATTGEEASATSRIRLSGNPGNWRSLEGVSC